MISGLISGSKVLPSLSHFKPANISVFSQRFKNMIFRNWQPWQYYTIKLKAKMSSEHLKSPEPFVVNGSNNFMIIVFDVKKSMVLKDSDHLPL